MSLNPVHVPGYARRSCLGRGIWGEVDNSSCISIQAQQFLVEAQFLRSRVVMGNQQLLYSLSGAISLLTSGGVSGGGVAAVGRYWSEVVRTEVQSAGSVTSEGDKELLKV